MSRSHPPVVVWSSEITVDKSPVVVHSFGRPEEPTQFLVCKLPTGHYFDADAQVVRDPEKPDGPGMNATRFRALVCAKTYLVLLNSADVDIMLGDIGSLTRAVLFEWLVAKHPDEYRAAISPPPGRPEEGPPSRRFLYAGPATFAAAVAIAGEGGRVWRPDSIGRYVVRDGKAHIPGDNTFGPIDPANHGGPESGWCGAPASWGTPPPGLLASDFDPASDGFRDAVLTSIKLLPRGDRVWVFAAFCRHCGRMCGEPSEGPCDYCRHPSEAAR